MSETAGKPPDWAADWIEQQRKKLRQGAASAGSSEGPTNVFSAFFQNLPKGFEGIAEAAQGFGPALGLMREHEQAWRELAEAQARYRQLESELLAQLNAVQLEALALLERRMRERAPSEPINEMRELYDLWVECGEEVYARCARGEPYCKAQASVANAATELRLKQQVILERGLRMFDLPTRSEVNSVHRQVRELKERLDALTKPREQAISRSSTPRRKSAARRKST